MFIHCGAGLVDNGVKPLTDAIVLDDATVDLPVDLVVLRPRSTDAGGSATRRRVRIPATVDGEDAGALAVMSQGQLDALRSSSPGH